MLKLWLFVSCRFCRYLSYGEVQPFLLRLFSPLDSPRRYLSNKIGFISFGVLLQKLLQFWPILTGNSGGLDRKFRGVNPGISGLDTGRKFFQLAPEVPGCEPRNIRPNRRNFRPNFRSTFWVRCAKWCYAPETSSEI